LVDQAEIHEMVSSKDLEDRIEAARALDSSFSHLPDKIQGWQDLHKFIPVIQGSEESPHETESKDNC
jgi:hypothetical protein